MMTETTTKATITVTFYFGDGENPLYRLSKKYLVFGWHDQTELRQWVDEIAAEMNHLSRYGIFSITVNCTQFKFSVDYKNKFIPCYNGQPELHWTCSFFEHCIKFTSRRGHGILWLEIPRYYLKTEYEYNRPIEKYQDEDKWFKVSFAPNDRLNYDFDNPFLIAFSRKIAQGIILPNTIRYMYEFESMFAENYITHSISRDKLPKSQTTWYQWNKSLELEKKQAKKKAKLEKAGIVYTDKKGKKKAQQVYIIQLVSEGLENVYKIGISHAPGKRLQSLNTSNPFELKLVHKFVATPAEEAEANLHKRFSNNRMSGEWFRLSAEDIAELQKITVYSEGVFITIANG